MNRRPTAQPFSVAILLAVLAAPIPVAAQQRQPDRSQQSDAVYEPPTPDEQPAPSLPPDVLERVAGAVVLLELLDSQGRTTGTANGFVIGADLVVTNRHCIVRGSSAKVNLGAAGLFDIEGIVAESDYLDVVFLRAQLPPRMVTPLQWAPAVPTKRTPVAIVVRNRQGEVTCSPGWSRDPDFDDFSSALFLETSAPAWMGCSGSPLVDHQGRVVGVVNRLGDAMPTQTRTTGRVATCDDVRAVPHHDVTPLTDWWITNVGPNWIRADRWCRSADRYRERIPSQAETYYQQSLAERPRNFNTIWRYVYFLGTYKGDAAAESELDAQIERHPDLLELRILKGHKAFHESRLDDAIASYQSALTVRPSAVASFWLACAYWMKQDHAKAVAAFEDVLRAEPRHLRTLQSLARLYEQLHKPDDWRRVVELWIAQRPDDEEALIQMIAACPDDSHAPDKAVALARLYQLSPYAAARAQLPRGTQSASE